MYVYPFLINTCDFNAIIFENIVKKRMGDNRGY